MGKPEEQGNESISFDEEYVMKRGLKLYTCCWAPINRSPKALIFLCHGYAVDCSFQMRNTGVRLSAAGYAVHGMDYEGHGKSSGLFGFIPNLNAVVDDCHEFYMSVCEKTENKNKKKILLGESLGGLLALVLHRKDPTFWDGAVLVAPMCKISENVRPSMFVNNILGQVAKVIPTWKVVPAKDLIDAAIRTPEWREQVRNSPHCYKGKPRLKTGHEMLIMSMEMEKYLYQVSLPFLIVQGGEDAVTDPTVSQSLYVIAASKDKTFKLYPGMWHAITSGETLENMDIVFSDIISWLDQRTVIKEFVSEMERKANNDRLNSLKKHKDKTTIY